MAIDNVSMWTSGAIWLLTALVGAGIATGASQVRDALKERQQTRRIRMLLAAEMLPMMDSVAICCSHANFGEHASREGHAMRTALLRALLPPDAAAFKSSTSQLPLLDINEARSLVVFQGTLEMAKRMSLQYAERDEFPHDHTVVLASYWRAAARHALHVMEQYQTLMLAVTGETADQQMVDQLRRQLTAVRDGRWPRVAMRGDQLATLGPNEAQE
jgi:hypothetical protein